MYTYIFHKPLKNFLPRQAKKNSIFHILWSEFPILLVDFFRQTWETESGTTNMQYILKKELIWLR